MIARPGPDLLSTLFAGLAALAGAAAGSPAAPLPGLLPGLLPRDHFERLESVLVDLAWPAGAAFDAAGRLWVVEAEAHRVRAFGPEGAAGAVLGARGTGPGELRRPTGVACADGAVFVADTGNHRVVVFAADPGSAPSSIGGPGDAPGGLFEPRGVAVGAEHVFVADTGHDRVAVFTRSGEFVRSIGSRGVEPGRFRAPVGCALDRRGSLYVADSLNHRVQKLHPGGTPLFAFGGPGPHPGLFQEAAGLAYHDGHVFVADRFNHRVQVLDVQGRLRFAFGEPALDAGRADGRLFAPSAVAVSLDGSRAAVCEPLEGRVQVFERTDSKSEHRDDARPEGLARYGPRGGGGGDLLALIDPEQRAVRVYDTRAVDPVAITTLGTGGGAGQRFVAPVDCAVDAARQRVLVLDAGARRLESWRLAREPDAPPEYDRRMGRLVRALDLASLDDSGIDPRAVACDAGGRAYVVDAAQAAVLVLDRDLQIVGRWGGGDVLSAPIDVAVLPPADGGGQRVVVLDRDLLALHVFSPDGVPLARWPLGPPAGPHAPDPVAVLALGDGFVVNRGGGLLARYDSEGARDGALTAQIAPEAVGSPGSVGGNGDGAPAPAPPGFAAPGELLDAGNHLYLLEPGRRRGQVLDRKGRFLLMF